MPLRRTLSDYLASLLAASHRDAPDSEPEIVESELDILSNLVLKKNRVALARVINHLERHKETVNVVQHQYAQLPYSPATRWALRVETDLLQKQSQIENTHRQDMRALEFMQF